jgi:hypothetical protein
MIDQETMNFITVFAAGWGAVLSTIIAVVGVYHHYRNSYLITGDVTPIYPDGGQKIRLRNISNRDHIITGWIVFFGYKPNVEASDSEIIAHSEHDANDMRLEKYRAEVIILQEVFGIEYSTNILDGRSVYVCLVIAGKKKNKYIRLYPNY